MVHNSCCVVDCQNTGGNSNCKFYTFPTASWKLEQRQKWIIAVNRKNDRFIGGKKSEEETSPSYIPTKFPTIYKKTKINEETAISRHARFMKRRMASKNIAVSTMTTSSQMTVETQDIGMDNTIDVIAVRSDKDCQVNFLPNSNEAGKTCICSRYIYVSAEKCDEEIQTEIIDRESRSIVNRKKCKDTECNTPIQNFSEHSTETSEKLFLGFVSISKDEQLIDLAGVTFNNFKFLLKRTITSHKYAVANEDRLLIFLMKMKTGLTFSALSVLFSVHRTTVARIFYSTLDTLAAATANLVFWPRIDVVQATMPKCFHPKYTNTRVIIDCTEFKIEVPSTVDNRVYCYSHYKKTFTAKVLIGITPGGFICLKSKVAGGRKSDSQITIESGLIDKLEEGDVVLADKGFPEIKAAIDKSGRKVMIVVPPFLKKKKNFPL